MHRVTAAQPAGVIVYGWNEYESYASGAACQFFGDTTPRLNSPVRRTKWCYPYFTGRFYINGSLKIDGKFEGRALQADQLYIGTTGKVKTSVAANSVFVEGVIIGNIAAKSRVMLLPTAKIFGDIKTPELIIQNGVILEGRCVIANDLKASAKDGD